VFMMRASSDLAWSMPPASDGEPFRTSGRSLNLGPQNQDEDP
jgi:hypothetical protein